jgi:hypothetical protein
MARILITSAIPYINGIKHLGNLVGSQLPADLYARYMRGRGHEVMFICATDEHGTPAELAAAKAGKPVADYCAEMHAVQKDIAEGFRLSFDHFGRSSSPQNHRLTQHFAGRLADAGLIAEVSEKQMYSVADGRFLPDRYIEGTCPNCGYDRARGDQCENCTKQLDPTDLINPRSAISGSTDLEVRETKHLYLRQSALRDQLRDWIDQRNRLAHPDHLHRAEMAGRRRRVAGPRHHPRPALGRARSGRAIRTGRGWRARSSTSGSTRPSNTSRAPPNGPTRTACPMPHGNAGGAPTRAPMTSVMCSSWARTTCPSTPCPSPSRSWGRASRGSWSTTSSPSTT